MEAREEKLGSAFLVCQITSDARKRIAPANLASFIEFIRSAVAGKPVLHDSQSCLALRLPFEIHLKINLLAEDNVNSGKHETEF